LFFGFSSIFFYPCLFINQFKICCTNFGGIKAEGYQETNTNSNAGIDGGEYIMSRIEQ
jgi:hypothetical protein